MATIYAILINQYIFKYQLLLSATFYGINEEDQRGDEIELVINLNNNHNSTDLDNIDVKTQLEHQIQNQETKGSGWNFDKTNSMKTDFIKRVN